MELSILTKTVKEKFIFLNNYGYYFSEIKINKNNPDVIWINIIYKDDIKNEITIPFCPFENILRIDVSIYNYEQSKNLDVRNYINFKEGKSSGRVELKVLNLSDLDRELDLYVHEINNVFSKDLFNLIVNNDWSAIPNFDPRDDY